MLSLTSRYVASFVDHFSTYLFVPSVEHFSTYLSVPSVECYSTNKFAAFVLTPACLWLGHVSHRCWHYFADVKAKALSITLSLDI